ncbi:MAG: hypothetical protein J6K15_06335 [Lachnospiraceae bacterium]|nr:hypothetical protein [Lachnospiraceae bacterium]
MAVRKSVRERLDEHKTGKKTTGSVAGSSTVAQETGTRKSVSDRLTKHKLEKTLGLDTLESDLASVSETVSNIYGGWQTPDTMSNTRGSVSAMYDRLKNYKTYVNSASSEDLTEFNKGMDELIGGYESALNQWDSLASAYSQFVNADAYNSAKKDYELSEKYKGLDYAEVQKAKVDSEDDEWLSQYGVKVGYSSLKDYNTELENLSKQMASMYGEEKQKAQAYYDKLEAKRNQYELENASEKYSYLLDGEDFSERSKYKSTQSTKTFLGMEYTDYGDEVYEYINNVNGARDNLIAQYKEGNEPTELEQHGYEYMTPDEVGMFNALYAEDKKKAYDFLDDIAVSLSKRSYDKTTAAWNEMADNSALASVAMSAATPIFNMAGGMGSALATLEETVTGKEYNPYSGLRMPSNAATDIRQYVGENIADATYGMEIGGVNVPSFLYQTGMSIADTALGTKMFGKGFTAVMGMNSATQKAKDLKEAGEDEETILKGAVAAGLAEAVFEKFSIDNILKPKSAETLLGVLRETAKQMGIETLEEIFTEITNTISDTVLRQNTSDLMTAYETYRYRGYSEEEAKKLVGKDIASNVMWSGIGGALSGGVIGSASSGANYAGNASLGKIIRGNNNVTELGDIASGLNTEEYAKYLEQIKSGKISNARLGGMYGKVTEEIEKNYQAERENAVMHAIANRATELGEDKNSGVIASAVRKKFAHQSLTSEERTVLESDAAKTIMKEVESGEFKVDSNGSYKTASDTRERLMSVLTTSRETDTGREADEDNTSGNLPATERNASMEMLTEDMDEAMANAFVSLYKEGTDLKEYKDSFELAYSYGRNGFGTENVLKNRGVLTEEQAAKAYEAGIRSSVEENQKQIDEITKKHFSEVTPGTFDDSAIDRSKINTRQAAAVEFTKLFSKATGVNIVYFQSEADENGHRTAENGRYDRSTNTIYLDVYAGVNDTITEDAIIPTLSHEVTHWMKEKAPEAYSKLSGTIMDILAKEYEGTPVDLVHAEMKRHKDTYAREVTEEYAQDELIARACEDMLSGNRNAKEIISQMDENTARTFGEKLKMAFEKIKEWFADLLGTYKSNSEQAKIIRKYADRVNELQEAWDEAFDNAVKTNAVLGTESDAEQQEEVQYSERNMSSEQEYKNAISQWYSEGMPEGEVFIVGTTSDIVQGLGAMEVDIYINGDKIKTILETHPEITIEEIKKIPRILEKPIMILASKNRNRKKANSRMLLLGSVKGTNGLPVTSILDLKPIENRIRIDDMQKVVSSYTKDNDNRVDFIRESNVMYVDKKRATSLLRTMGFYAPIELNDSGFIGNISYFDEKVKLEGKPFSEVFNEMSNANENSQYSDRATESIYDAVGELKRLQEENAKLRKDVERLREKNRLEHTVTGGTVLDEERIASVASYLLENAGSTYSKDLLSEELKEVYQYLQSDDVEMDILLLKTTDVAQRIVGEGKDGTMSNNYAKEILSALRDTGISLSDAQKETARNIHGADWTKNYLGRVLVTNDGVPLEKAWQQWSEKYPDVFDSKTSDVDMVAEVLKIYDSVSASSVAAEAYDRTELERTIAMEIYNQFWNITPVRTLADKHEKEIKRLKYEHRMEMQEMKEKYRKQKEKAVEDTKEWYQRIIRNIRSKRQEEIRKVKEHSKERLETYKKNEQRRTLVKRITTNSMRLNQWLTENSAKKHIPEPIKKTVADFLNSIDFSSKQLLKKGKPTKADVQLADALVAVRKLAEEAEGVRTGTAEDINDCFGSYLDLPKGFSQQLGELCDTVNRIVRSGASGVHVLNNMTMEELDSFDKVVVTLKHTISQMNEFLAGSRTGSVSTNAQKSIQEMKELGEAGDFGKAFRKFFQWDNALPYYAFKRYGEGGRAIFRAFQNGWKTMAFRIKSITDFTEKTYTAKEARTWLEELHEFEFIVEGKEKVVQVSTAQIMSLYCLSKRSQAIDHLKGGGIRVGDIKVGMKTISQAFGIRLTAARINEMTNKLTDRQKKVADQLQSFMSSTCADWGNEVSMRRFGYRAFTEENYFPIQSDKNNIETNDATMEENSLYRLLNMSFAKKLTPGANNRVVLNDIFTVFAQHTSDMAKYNALALPVLDAFKWYNYKEQIDGLEGEGYENSSVKEAMEYAYGLDAQKYFIQFMRDINGSQSAGVGEELAKPFMSKYKVAAVAGNLRVVVLQPLSYIRAMNVMDPKYLFGSAVFRRSKADTAMKYSGIALWKAMGFYDTNISRNVQSMIKHDESWKDKAVEWSLKGAEVADRYTWGKLWGACEAEIKDKRPELKPGSEAFNQIVAERFDEVIYATQVVDSTLTRTHLMRSKSAWTQILTSFMSEPMVSYNMLLECYMDWQADVRKGNKAIALQKNGKKIMRATATFVISAAVTSVVEGLVDTWRDRDEEKDWGENILENIVDSLKGNINPLATIPIVRDAFSVKAGYNLSRMDEEFISSIIYAYERLLKDIEEGELSYKTVYNMLKAISQASGLPLNNLTREVISFWNNTVGTAYPSCKVE